MALSASIPLLICSTLLVTISFCNGKCVQHESEALIEFKRGLIDYSGKLASWESETDCCSWVGVVCDEYTGHVVQLHLEGDNDVVDGKFKGNISDSLLELKHLKYFDLSNNDFNGISIPDFFRFMSTLRLLNLSSSGFGGAIPRFICNLTSLGTLDLSENYFIGEIPHELGNLSDLQYLSIRPDLPGSTYIYKSDWVSRLSSLKFLDFSGVNLSIAYDWAKNLGKLPSLKQLHLSSCELTRIPPSSNLNFSSLLVLDLYHNNLKASIPENWFTGFTQLEHLDLEWNELEGQIPSSIGNLTFLKTLDLSSNSFAGKIPSSFGNLTLLGTLDLSFNNLEGPVPMPLKNLCNVRLLSLSKNRMGQEVNELIEILSGCASDNLESLQLFNSQFSGYLSDSLCKFKSLVRLDISLNSITGPLPVSLGEMTSLTFLDLSSNKLNGSLPSSLGRLENLTSLHVSNNFLEGEVSENHFRNLYNLRVLHASENHLIWKVDLEWVPPFQLIENLYLKSCEIGPQFPTWLRHLKHLERLELSNSSINSPFPRWVLNFSSSLSEMDLSHNHMYGTISNLSMDCSFIDLSSNHFEGPLPYMENPYWIDLSHNFFSGSIHNFLCNKQFPQVFSIEAVILKENLLNGEIPINCWMNWTLLEVLDLSNNNLRGNIPISLDTLTSMKLLSLRNNNLNGEIPSTLQSCERLVALDLGENELTGEIPSWIGNYLKELKVLNIRGNKFHGQMPKQLCNLTNLQILDFAYNYLNGTIPTCVGSLIGMSQVISSAASSTISISMYVGSSAIMRKGQMVEYNTTLGYVKSFDLSNNNFAGEIPLGITNLSGLQCLNLSNNFLTGAIPMDIGTIQELESLDLSNNHLFGEISPSMSSMTFLSYLNLSHNNLSGKIPMSTQLQSMDNSSFVGNKLCGPPLTKDCNNNEVSPPADANGNKVGDGFYFYVSLALGFVVGFWGVVGPLAFNVRWRRSYYNFLKVLWDKMWVWYQVYIVRFVRSCRD